MREGQKKQKLKVISDTNSYEKLKIVGQGTFGKVYLMRNMNDGRIYAVKEVIQDKRYKNRELSIIKKVKHQNVIGIVDYFFKIIAGDCYLSLVMEYVPSCLSNILKETRKKKQTISAKQRKLYAFQLLKGLHYLESLKICHRDLKPPNILLNTETNELKICDFGSAKVIEQGEQNVSYICSRYYRSPELLFGQTQYRYDIDMWSAGCIIAELLSLEPIFPGDSTIEQLIEIIKILGSPPTNYTEVAERNQDVEIKLPKVKPMEWESVLKRYKPSKEEVELISNILTYEDRYTPFQALKHPYFHDLMTYKSELKSIPHLFSFDHNITNPHMKEEIIILKQLYPYKEEEILLVEKRKEKEQNIKVESTPPTAL